MECIKPLRIGRKLVRRTASLNHKGTAAATKAEILIVCLKTAQNVAVS